MGEMKAGEKREVLCVIDVQVDVVGLLENRVKQLEDGMEELASIMREELAELRRKIGNR
jgi:hypothetical protein